MQKIKGIFKPGWSGVAVILSEEDYLTFYDYRNRPKQRKLQAEISRQLRELAGHQQGYAEDRWINRVAQNNNVDSKYVRGWIYNSRNCWVCGAKLNDNEDTVCQFTHRDPNKKLNNPLDYKSKGFETSDRCADCKYFHPKNDDGDGYCEHLRERIDQDELCEEFYPRFK